MYFQFRAELRPGIVMDKVNWIYWIKSILLGTATRKQNLKKMISRFCGGRSGYVFL